MSAISCANADSTCDLYITLSEAARRLRTTAYALRVNRRDGMLPPPVRIGRRWKYSVAQLSQQFPELARHSEAAVNGH